MMKSTSISGLRTRSLHRKALASNTCFPHFNNCHTRTGTIIRPFPPLVALIRYFSCSKHSRGEGFSSYAKVWEVPIAGTSGPACKEKLYELCSSSRRWTPAPHAEVSNEKDQCKQQSSDTAFVPPIKVLESFKHHTIKHLMPNRYPDSVHSSYKKYAMYSFIANTASTATMVLSTQSLLLAIGVGQHAAAPISATLNWILKDGIGQFGGILFASKISSSNNSVDADPKRWRMVSGLAMDCAMMMELMTPAFPGYFLFMASAANIGKNIAFLTASASRAKIHQCLATGKEANNLGDITGKATSQSILASLTGTCMGIGVSPYVLHDLVSVGLTCVALSAVNQVCTYQSLKGVPVDNLNRQRLMILMELYFRHMNSRKFDLSPEKVAELESFMPLVHNSDVHKWLHIGCSISILAPNGPEELNRLHKKNEKYILNCEMCSGVTEDQSVYLTFLHNAIDEDILRGTFQAYAVRLFALGKLDIGGNIDDNQRFDVITSSHQYMMDHFDDFHASVLRAGWIFENGKNIVLESSSDRRLKFESDVK